MLACSKNISPAGPRLIEKAREIAPHIGRHTVTSGLQWLFAKVEGAERTASTKYPVPLVHLPVY